MLSCMKESRGKVLSSDYYTNGISMPSFITVLNRVFEIVKPTRRTSGVHVPAGSAYCTYLSMLTV